MSDITPIPFSPAKTDMAAMHFTQSKTGHVHSPWFTFDWMREAGAGQPVHGWFNSRTSNIVNAARAAFAGVLGVDVDATIATVMPPAPGADNPHETKWRVSTQHPCALPNPPKPRVTMARGDEIEIEAAPSVARIQ